MKHKKNFLSIFVLMLSFAVLIVGGLVIWDTLGKETSAETPIINTDDYYSIRKNATDLQVDLYKQLLDAIKNSKSDETVAGLVAQNFVADYFTFANKLKVNDIGGLQFIDPTLKVSVYRQAKDTLYSVLLEHLNNNTVNQTLEVASVNGVSAQKIDFTLLGEEDDDGEREESIVDAIEVVVRWTYLPSTEIDSTKYDTEAQIILMKDGNGIYYIVGVNHEEETQ
ncbi:hypothetical protein AOC36_09450 [Erysipelothrix larvae]|uniref:Uncharacterized protein n=1 Tax=Erysipelothrix larvae TaxID=1514105 RepID=A0A0X8H1M9_9FIRM|nr:hypothetical protein [Erysipelothrix larvae]AMC94199.1 hypothetical protein AOC36_09450 [Erysipelothrix larvae]